MTDYIAIAVTVLFTIATSLVLGRYMFKVFTGGRTLLDPVLLPIERLILRLTGVRPDAQQTWQRYSISVLPALIPERVMVCMSSNAAAPRVLRTGARIAGRVGAKWFAVYVETPRERPGRIRSTDSSTLAENITLAESLGATVVRVKAERPAEGLIAFAQREGVTHVIFGQSARSRWELVWQGSTLDRFLAGVPDAAVQVVPLTEEGP